MLRFVRYCLSICVLFSINSNAGSFDSSPHVIFLVHGILGDDTTFGDLTEILTSDYSKKKNVLIKELYYPSQPKDGELEYIKGMIPTDFAQIINTQIVNFFFEHSLPSDTPISFIAHSQGGLVVMRYFNTCTKDNGLTKKLKKYCEYYDGVSQLENAGWFNPGKRPEWLGKKEPNLKARLARHYEAKTKFPSPKNIKNIVSVGTPFWGSAFANQYINEGSLMNGVLKLLKFPNKQIKDLSIGSQEPTRLRYMLLNHGLGTLDINEAELPSDIFESLRIKGTNTDISQGIRFFNLAGYSKSRLYWFLRSPTLENDMVVGVPEARMDFLYYVEPKEPGEKLLNGFASASKAFYPTGMVHIGLLPFMSAPMAQVEWANHKNHLGYILVRRIFDNEFKFSDTFELTQEEKNKYFIDSLSNFTSEVKLSTPKGFHRQFVIRASLPHPNVPANFKKVVLESSIFTDPSGQNENGALIKNYYAQTYYHVGKVSEALAFLPKQETLEQAITERGTQKVRYKFNVVGFKTKAATLEVFPSVNSYAELLLEPFHPIPPATVQKVGRLGEYSILHVMGKNKDTFDVLAINQNFEVKRISSTLTPADLALLPYCNLGLLGKASPSALAKTVTKDKNFSDWEEYALNKTYIFRNFDDANLIGFNDSELASFAKGQGAFIEHGYPLEILGRHKVDIASKTYDRYLVTSPIIRAADQRGMKFSDIGKKAGLGLRWVNVVDIDILEKPEVAKEIYKPSGKIVQIETLSYPRDSKNACLKDDTTFVYPRTKYFQNKYYLEDHPLLLHAK